MRQFLLVMLREYQSRMRARAAVIVIMIGLVLMVGGSALLNTLSKSESAKPVEVTVLDQTGWVLPGLQAAVAATEGAEGRPIKLSTATETDEAKLLTQAKEGAIKLLLVLTGKDALSFKATFYSSSLGNMGTGQERLGPLLDGVVRSQRVQAVGADPKVIAALTAPVPIQAEFLAASGSSGIGQRIGIATAFIAILYTTILLFCSLVLQGVLEEKTSRVAEVLIATVKPMGLMAGKVVGIGLAGLTLLLIWAGGYLLAPAAGVLVMPLEAVGIGPSIWGWLILFFVMGYFLYASLFAAGGASISRLEEAQMAQMPLMIPSIIAYMVSIFAIQNPTGTVAVICSYIPFTAPTVMLTRILLGEPAVWEIALSITLTFLTGIGLTWLSSRIYKAGILRYDGRLTFKGMLQSLRPGA
ncbi:MAG TPA: ABC transporter permease [Symbiobacteriaceae bacterium]|nr:ABC transporter permease [Symbiobacteriaceae bacterium]